MTHTTLERPSNLDGPDGGNLGNGQTCPLRLANGIELLGEYQDSGYTQAPYLIRRGDGHNVQVSRLVYLVAEALVTHNDVDSVAEEVSRRFGRDVSADNVVYLIENKLVPVGVVPRLGDDPASAATAKPLLALRLRLPLVPERTHRVVTTALKPLFWPPIIVAALLALLVADAWLVTSERNSVGHGMQMIIFEPKLLLALTVLTVIAGVFHELGHAAAARYGGAKPGAMGAGIYLVWPVFYTDVTDTYRLDRRGRLRTDFGGIYFNVLFTLGTVAMFVATGYTPLLVLVGVVQLETLRQFLPFVRLDGFYVMSDLAGVPNLFAYMRPVLTVLVRRRNIEAREQAKQKLQELNSRSRKLIIGWVVVTAPILLVGISLFLFFLPRVAGIAWGSAGFQIDAMTTATGSITPVGVVNGTVNLLLLALPVAGMTYILVMLLRRGTTFAVRSWPNRPVVTGAVTAVVLAVLMFQVGTVWPSTFESALRGTQAEPTQGLRPRPVQTALRNLPAGLSVLAGTPPGAPPIRIAMPEGGEPPLPPPAGPDAVPPFPGADTGESDQAGSGSAGENGRGTPGASGPDGGSAPTPSRPPQGPRAQPEGAPPASGGEQGPAPVLDLTAPDAGGNEQQPAAPPPEKEATPFQRLAGVVQGLLGFQTLPDL